MKVQSWLAAHLAICCSPSALCNGADNKDVPAGYPNCFDETSKNCVGLLAFGCLCFTNTGLMNFAQCVGRKYLEVSEVWEQLAYDCKMIIGSDAIWSKEIFHQQAARATA